jgi:hypothetical protein
MTVMKFYKNIILILLFSSFVILHVEARKGVKGPKGDPADGTVGPPGPKGDIGDSGFRGDDIIQIAPHDILSQVKSRAVPRQICTSGRTQKGAPLINSHGN